MSGRWLLQGRDLLEALDTMIAMQVPFWHVPLCAYKAHGCPRVVVSRHNKINADIQVKQVDGA